MKYLSTEATQGRTIIARLKPGQELVAALGALCKDNNINAGYLPVLLGGFKNVKINSMTHGKNEDYPDDFVLEYREPLEYFGSGTIAEVKGKPSIHIHLMAAQKGNKAIGGHLISGEIVFLTEVVIVELVGVTMTRKPDPEVFNYPLLNFS